MRRIVTHDVNMEDLWRQVEIHWAAVKKRPADAGLSETEVNKLPAEAGTAINLVPSAGSTPAATEVLIVLLPAAAGVAQHVALTIWDELILPRLIRHYGADKVQSGGEK